MRPRSMAKKLEGTVKEILGTAQSVGCTVNGQHPHDVVDAIRSGDIVIPEDLLIPRGEQLQQCISNHYVQENNQSSGMTMSPLLIASTTSCGCWPFTVQPTDCAVPRISFTVPSSFLAIERGRICLAMLMI
uniref:Large ribosomal subunit protein uL11 n=1 Tax=Ascaris suum TaxID=6253 RepID=F1L5Q5_ASCSU